MRRVLLVVSMLLTVGTAVADSETTSTLVEVFEAANVAASRADYGAAVRGYERLVDAGVRDADVYFNLGTAYAKAGTYPSAILSYERALELRPSDDKAQENLRSAERVLEERRAEAEGEAVIQRNSSLSEAVYSSFGEDALAYGLIVANVVLFGCLALFWMRRRRAPKLVAAAVVSGSVLLFCALGLATKSGVFRDGLRAVVIGDRVSLREGPDPKASIRGIARGGDRALVTASDGEFLKLRVISGAEGWTPASSVGLVDPDERLH